MTDFSTATLQLMFTEWARKTDVTVTPEEEILVTAALTHAKVADLAESKVPDIVGPLLCVNDEDSLEFPRWWAQTISQLGIHTPSIKSAPTVNIDQEIDWGKLKLGAALATLLLLCVAAVVTFWQPIEDLICQRLISETQQTQGQLGALHQWLNCPVTEKAPDVPKNEEPEAPSAGSGGVYTDPINTAVVLPLRRPTLMFRESDLSVAEEIVEAPSWWLLPILPLLAGFLTWCLTQRLRKKLEQVQTRQQTEKQVIDRLSLARSSLLFVDPRNTSSLASLRYHEAGRPKLHIRSSVRATGKTGLPVLKYQARQRRREFVLIVPRWRPGDWRSCYFSTLATELAENGVTVHLYSYQHVPTRLYPTLGYQRSDTLFTLLSQYPQATVIVGVNESAAFHRVFGNQLPWLNDLRQWRSHLLWFDTPCDAARAARLKEKGFQLVEMTEFGGVGQLFDQLVTEQFEDGSNGSGQSSRIGEVASAVGYSSHYKLPEHLKHMGDPSVIHNKPDTTEVAQLVEWLRSVLGRQAFDLLCATAVYPKPDWRLTRLLKDVLDTDHSAENETYVGERKYLEGSLRQLRRLAQLPWLQHGYFPLWLRLALIETLSREREATIAEVYAQLLNGADTQASVGAYDLTIDVAKGGWFRGWLDEWRETGALKDVLFASVLSRRGSFRLPQQLSRLLRRQHLRLGARWPQVKWTGFATLAGLVLALLLVVGVGTQVIDEDTKKREAASVRLAQNGQVTVKILYDPYPEYPEAAAQMVSGVEYHLESMNYRVERELLVSEDSLDQSTPVPIDNNEAWYSLSAPAAHVGLLKRISEYALYDSGVVSKASSPESSLATLVLERPLFSGQVFRDRVLELGEVPIPKNETGDLVVSEVDFAASPMARCEILDRVWKSEVVSFYQKKIEGFYPIEKAVDQEMSLDDFGAFFGYGGILDQFFETYLIDDLTINGAELIWIGEGENCLSKGTLRSIATADQIRREFFSGNDQLPFLKLRLEPVRLRMSPQVDQMFLDIGGVEFRYFHGPVAGITEFHWPSQKGIAEASLKVEPLIPGAVSNISEIGQWAVFRLLDEGAHTYREGRSTFDFSFGDRIISLSFVIGDGVGSYLEAIRSFKLTPNLK